eukprot:m.290874 g.290874  ORF g.290874 m.290874 type:complete len:130 (+) comp12373_c0_seq1:1858-2247(+)
MVATTVALLEECFLGHPTVAILISIRAFTCFPLWLSLPQAIRSPPPALMCPWVRLQGSSKLVYSGGRLGILPNFFGRGWRPWAWPQRLSSTTTKTTLALLVLHPTSFFFERDTVTRIAGLIRITPHFSH